MYQIIANALKRVIQYIRELFATGRAVLHYDENGLTVQLKPKKALINR